MHPTYCGSTVAVGNVYGYDGYGTVSWGGITCKRVKDVKMQPNSMGSFGYALKPRGGKGETFRVVRIVSRLVLLSQIRRMRGSHIKS